MQTISAEEFKRRYGTQGVASFSQSPEEKKKPGFIDRVKQAFSGGISQVKQGVSDAANAKNPLQLFESSAKIGSGVVNSAFSPIAPVMDATIGKGVNYAADKISNSPGVQKFATSKAGEITSRAAEDVGNVSNIALAVGGTKFAKAEIPKVGRAIGEAVPKIPTPDMTTAKNFVNDLKPTAQGTINHQVSQALDLTPGDLNKLAQSTGNEAGKWLADKNAIGGNKAETVTNIQKIFDENYTGVRSEIAKVKTVYKPNQVPRYVESLKAVLKKVEDTPGMQKTSVEVENLLNKKDISLKDVQRVKELLDEHFNLYKQTGDVGEGVQKQGLANIRGEMKTFIENEVKANTGADIRGMNNDVSTSKGLMDMIETRSPRGLTRGNFKLGDLAITGYGLALGGPLGGVAALFFKKLYDSPTMKLKFSKWLDSVSDAQKAKMDTTLNQGKIPPEFNQFIKKK